MKKLFSLFIFILISNASFAQFGVGYTERGIISYYTAGKSPRITASGEKYDNTDLVACHPKLPFNTKVRITNLANEKSVIVRINDRGPYAYGRIMDISETAAEKIDLIKTGTAKVDIEVVGEAVPNFEESARTDKKQMEADSKVVTSVNESNFKLNTTYSQWGTEKNPMGYTVQTVAFESFKKATDYCKFLKGKGFTNEMIFIEVALDKNARKMYKVLLGEYEEKSQADLVGSKYKISTNNNPWVRKHIR